MSLLDLSFLVLAALVAGIVNGLLGHGFSSLMVPAGLLLAPVRLLNPTLVLIELPLNGSAAFLHRHRAKGLLGELLPFALALLPGVALGALLLRLLPEGALKAICYSLLLLLVLAQVLLREARPRPLGIGAKLRSGFATGALYGLATLSGPTLAAYVRRRGYAKDDARAVLAFLRALEGALSLLSLFLLGLFTWQSLRLAALLLPAGLIGLAVGHRLAAKVDERRFRRLALRFNLLAVLTGLARAVAHLPRVPSFLGALLGAAAAVSALWLLLDWAPPLASEPETEEIA